MVTTNISNRAPMSRERLTGSGTGAPSREVSGWKKGSIVSLKMKNFLVYKDAKAVFGPRLNMVVGPNGSGKSTLVCAIALGLGGSPKVLGRADNLSAFVMHGVKEDASVTVELYMPDGNNLHVTRTFSRKNNSSNWHINGRSHSTKEVENKIRALGIQVDNLCTMLPQDKVGDFSGFTPDKLLLETEKALSSTELYDPHMKLVDLQDSKGKSQNEEETTRTKLEGMESELSTLEKDVQRYQERQEKQNRLELHRQRKVWAGVETLRNQGIEAKQLEKDAVVELKMAQQADQPLQDEYKKWERQQERLRGAEKTRVKRRTDLEKAIGDKNEKIVKISGNAETTMSELKNLETRRKNDQEKLAKMKRHLEQNLEKLESLLEKAEASPSVAEIQHEIERKQMEVQAAKQDVQGQESLIQKIRLELREKDDRIKALTNQKAVREQKFRTRFREEGKVGLDVRDWAARNGDKLKGQVVGPIGLEVTVEDDEAARAVETHIPSYVWCSMVVSCKEDHDVIIKAFKNQRVSLGILVNQGGTLRPSKSTFSQSEMAQLKERGGVRGFLDDFIECPDTVRQVLRRNQKIDTVFLGSAMTQQTIANDPEFLPRLGKRGPQGVPTGSAIYAGGSHGAPPGSRNVEPLQMYQTKISLYGARKPSVRVSETRKAQVVGPGVDNEAVAAAQGEIARLEARQVAANLKKDKLFDTFSGLDKMVKDLHNDHHNAREEKKRRGTVKAKIKSLEGGIPVLETKLAEGGGAEKAKLTKRLEKILEQHAATLKEAQDQASAMLEVSLEVLAATCARRVAGDKLEETSEALRNAQEARADLEQTVKELKAKKSQYHKQFLAEKKKAEHVAPRWIGDDQSNLTEFGEKYGELPDNVLQLDAVIEDLTEDLSGSVHNPQVIKKYEKLKEETDTTRKALSELVEGNLNANERMNSIRTPWKEKLQDMVAQLNDLFREYMSKMDGCGGEVRLAEDESSFKKWGIEIRVRFRSEADGGKMAVLNQRVHSGGERSVSTILFLMALQDLQHSPFRVVDEINQGMDPKNERQVFSRIVLNSCGPSRKQYFLITPKLLQGLVAMDNDDITIIVIMNGVNTIKGTEEHSMQKFIAAKKRQRALKDGDAQGNGPQQRRRIS